MKFFAFLLTFLLCVVNLKYAACLKCQFDYGLFGYACNLKPDSSSMKEKHVAGKTDENVKTIEFEGFNKKDLTQLDLTDLSPFCQRFENATFVWIRELKSVNENLIQQCTNLKNIWIEGLEMEEIPENLFSFNSNLIVIYLNFGKLRTLQENVFSKQNELKTLNLDHNQISCLPPNIFKSLTKLRYLSLNSNKIQALNPKWFESLQSLDRLLLNNNEIQDLPKNAFANLSNLKELSIQSNQLTTIHSDSFGIQKNLLAIEFQNNKINAIDERILIKTAVEWLDMSENVCSDEFNIQGNEIREKLSNCFNNYQPRVEPTTFHIDLKNPKCGPYTRSFGLVHHGDVTTKNEFPWNVALIKTGGDLLGGGTIFSSKHILTAAHCIHNKQSKRLSTDDFSVMLGVHNHKMSEEAGRISVKVNFIYIHPDWDIYSESCDADIAILELAKEVEFNKFIQPICIPDIDSNVGKLRRGIAVGFGITENDAISDVANKLKIPIYDYQNCTEHNPDHQPLISDRTFCGGPANKSGVCNGDSGCGVYVIHQRKYYLRGIVSSALRNEVNECDVTRVAVFTDVPNFYGWIKHGGMDTCANNKQD